MQVMRFAEARRYDAPKHFDMRSLRLQGLEASSADFAWVGLSHFLPEGGAEMDAGATGKIYVVVDGRGHGQLADGGSHVLRRWTAVSFRRAKRARVRNATNAVASMLVVMPHPGRADDPARDRHGRPVRHHGQVGHHRRSDRSIRQGGLRRLGQRRRTPDRDRGQCRRAGNAESGTGERRGLGANRRLAPGHRGAIATPSWPRRSKPMAASTSSSSRRG